MKIVAAKAILKANDQLAAENRHRFTAERVFGVNLVGSPGCGKTTLLEGLFAATAGAARAGGDRRRHRRSDRRRAHGEDRRAGGADQHRRHVPPGRQHDRRRGGRS